MDDSDTGAEVAAEELAALLDGRLGPEARTRVLAELAMSEEHLALFADAAAAAAATAALSSSRPEQANSDAPIPLASRRRLPPSALRKAAPWLVAASIAATVLLPSAMSHYLGDTTAIPADGAGVTASVPPHATIPSAWDDHPWALTRGEAGRLSDSTLAVRLGARITDLRVALQSHDRRATEYASNIAVMVDDLPAAGPLAESYRLIARQADTSAPADLRDHADRSAAAVSRFLNPDLVRLGSWLEAARLAAARHDASFFTTPASTAALELIHDQPTKTDASRTDATRTLIDQIQSELHSSRIDWPAVSRNLDSILYRLAS